MKLLTIQQFSESHPAFPVGGLRHLRFHANSNGFAPAFKTIGRRVYIDPEKFFEIVDAQNRQKAQQL